MVPTDLLYRELLLQRKPTVSSVTTNTLCGWGPHSFSHLQTPDETSKDHSFVLSRQLLQGVGNMVIPLNSQSMNHWHTSLARKLVPWSEEMLCRLP
jgi:hypothetical protein